MKIITDKNKIDEVLERGVENVYTREVLEKKLKSGKRLRVYLGIDPTGNTLHLGHIIPIRKLKQFQDLGHQIILLMGDFTAMIGDPTDKKATRKQLTHKQVLSNLKNYKKQASKFIKFNGPNKALIKFNSKWLSKMKFGDVLELASKMTVDQMEKRSMFVERNKEGKPVFIHEFMYPLMQGYDSVAMNVDVEIGGNDQTFNMLTGRHLMSQIKNKEKSVISMKLLEDNTGKKMGKTEGNMVSLIDSPFEIFSKVMSWSDNLIEKGFEVCTDIDKNIYLKKQDPKEAKIFLAFEITKSFYDKDKATKAKKEWEETFSKKEIPETVEEFLCQKDDLLIDVCEKNKIVSSRSEYRRLLKEGAVKNLTKDTKIELPEQKVENGVYRLGKKRFFKITFQ